MVPTIGQQGTTLLVRKFPYVDTKRVFVGDAVFLKDLERDNKYLGYEMISTDPNDTPFVLEGGQCWVLSDNESLKPKEARDSRIFGPVSVADIMGRVIYSLRSAVDHGPIKNSRSGMLRDNPVLAVELDVLREKFINTSETAKWILVFPQAFEYFTQVSSGSKIFIPQAFEYFTQVSSGSKIFIPLLSTVNPRALALISTVSPFKISLQVPQEQVRFFRTALVALIAFMPTNPDGALGSLDYKKEERRALAIKSREAAPKFGTPERQKIINEAFLIALVAESQGVLELVRYVSSPIREANHLKRFRKISAAAEWRRREDATEGSADGEVKSLQRRRREISTAPEKNSTEKTCCCRVAKQHRFLKISA
ncbi:hypothetical protein ACLOJK_008281 [Asimina triloba]